MQIKCPQCKSEEVVKRGLSAPEDINKLIEETRKGFEIYYNWIRNHQALEGKTPSELACPNVELQNKNGWLELIQRGYDGK